MYLFLKNLTYSIATQKFNDSQVINFFSGKESFVAENVFIWGYEY